MSQHTLSNYSFANLWHETLAEAKRGLPHDDLDPVAVARMRASVAFSTETAHDAAVSAARALQSSVHHLVNVLERDGVGAAIEGEPIQTFSASLADALLTFRVRRAHLAEVNRATRGK